MEKDIIQYYDKLDFNDVLIKPNDVSDIISRSEIDITDNNGMLPLFTAPMDTVVDTNNFEEFEKLGINVCLPRGEFGGENSFISYSLKDFKELYLNCEADDVPKFHVLIDTANGHIKDMVDTIVEAKKIWGDKMVLMVGNIANPNTYVMLSDAGADYIRVGIGNGCFAKGSRVLMSNGYYKNIEDINIGEYVINMHGQPVKVKRVINNGFREVLSVKTSMSPKPTFVTNNHEYYVGNYSKKTKDSKGYKKSITSNSWRFISEYTDDFTPLFPTNIHFNLKNSFRIDLTDYAINKKYCENYNTLIEPSYEVGYIFGTFLGDGNSVIKENLLEGINGLKKSTSGSVHWSFGLNEIVIAEKLKQSIKKVFNLDVTIEETDNMLKVHLYNKPLAHFLSDFNKKDEKSLPKKLLVNDVNYLRGIYDGLIDSDGNHGTDNDKRKSFHNTSLELIELFNIIHFKLNNELPNSNVRLDNTSNLVETSNPLYGSRLLLEGNRRKTKCEKFIINKITEHKPTDEIVEVFDIEVDCETHSFILDNCIVHNSGCLTTQQTGVGYPMASLIRGCYWKSCTMNKPAKIVADGGMKTYSDIIKALALGADYVMLGSILNKCLESCGKNYIFKKIPITPNGAKKGYKLGMSIYKKFRGMSTKEVQKKWGNTILKTSEGVVRYQKVEYTLRGWVDNFDSYLRSAMSYSDAKNLTEFTEKAEIIKISNNSYKRFNK